MNNISSKKRSKKSSKRNKSPNKLFRNSPTLHDIDDIFLGQTVSSSDNNGYTQIDNSKEKLQDKSKYKKTISVSPNTKTINIKKYNNSQFLHNTSKQSAQNNTSHPSSTSLTSAPNVITKSVESIPNTSVKTTTNHLSTLKPSINTSPTSPKKHLNYSNSNNICAQTKVVQNSNIVGEQNKIYEYYPLRKYSPNNTISNTFDNKLTKNELKYTNNRKKISKNDNIQHITNQNTDTVRTNNQPYSKNKNEISIAQYNKALKETDNTDRTNNHAKKITVFTNLDNFEKVNHIFEPYVYYELKENQKYYTNFRDIADKYILSIITNGIIINPNT